MPSKPSGSTKKPSSKASTLVSSLRSAISKVQEDLVLTTAKTIKNSRLPVRIESKRYEGQIDYIIDMKEVDTIGYSYSLHVSDQCVCRWIVGWTFTPNKRIRTLIEGPQFIKSLIKSLGLKEESPSRRRQFKKVSEEEMIDNLINSYPPLPFNSKDFLPARGKNSARSSILDTTSSALKTLQSEKGQAWLKDLNIAQQKNAHKINKEKIESSSAQVANATSIRFVVTPQKDKEIELRIGGTCPEFDKWLRAKRTKKWTLPTAFNPNGRALSDAGNDRRRKDLQSLLTDLNYPVNDGYSETNNEKWPRKSHSLALGMSPKEAAMIGYIFDQDYVLTGSLENQSILTNCNTWPLKTIGGQPGLYWEAGEILFLVICQGLFKYRIKYHDRLGFEFIRDLSQCQHAKRWRPGKRITTRKELVGDNRSWGFTPISKRWAAALRKNPLEMVTKTAEMVTRKQKKIAFPKKS